MICSKEFSITVEGSCTGLAFDAAWEYDPNHASGVQPPVGLTLTDQFEGYFGTFRAVKPVDGTLANFPVAEWRTDWTTGSGTLTVRATLVGTMDRTGTGVGVTVRCRADADGTVVDDTILCPAGMVTQVNLEAIAVKAGIAGPTYADVNHNLAAQGIYDISGEVFLSCT